MKLLSATLRNRTAGSANVPSGLIAAGDRPRRAELARGDDRALARRRVDRAAEVSGRSERVSYV